MVGGARVTSASAIGRNKLGSSNRRLWRVDKPSRSPSRKLDYMLRPQCEVSRGLASYP